MRQAGELDSLTLDTLTTRRWRLQEVWACLWVACYARCQPGSLELELLVARVRAGAEVSSFPSA
jgi:hypothetical protein